MPRVSLRIFSRGMLNSLLLFFLFFFQKKYLPVSSRSQIITPFTTPGLARCRWSLVMIGGAMSKRSLRIDVEVASLFYELLTRCYLAVPRMQLTRRGLKFFFFFRTNSPEYFPLNVEIVGIKLSILSLFRSQKIIDNLLVLNLRFFLFFFKKTILKKLST